MPTRIAIATTDAERKFVVDDAFATFTPTTASTEPALVLPAEAFVRLVYGRLDPDQRPGRGRRSPR